MVRWMELRMVPMVAPSSVWAVINSSLRVSRKLATWHSASGGVGVWRQNRDGSSWAELTPSGRTPKLFSTSLRFYQRRLKKSLTASVRLEALRLTSFTAWVCVLTTLIYSKYIKFDLSRKYANKKHLTRIKTHYLYCKTLHCLLVNFYKRSVDKILKQKYLWFIHMSICFLFQKFVFLGFTKY